MGLFLPVVAGVGLLVVGYGVARYLKRAGDRLVEARERCEKTWSDVDVLLERRRSELQKLIDLTNEHVAEERDRLADVAAAREGAIGAANPESEGSVDPGEAPDVLVELRERADQVYALSEEYPELAADERFAELSSSIRRMERRLEDRREQYNEAVAAYNALLSSVPEAVFARLYGFERREPFVASRAAREGVDVGERLSVAPDDGAGPDSGAAPAGADGGPDGGPGTGPGAGTDGGDADRDPDSAAGPGAADPGR